jgi:signal transduction histidine kinase
MTRIRKRLLLRSRTETRHRELLTSGFIHTLPAVMFPFPHSTERDQTTRTMEPILSGTLDSDKLQDLGRASLQIVHDLKNQLNGLKLYATFLRRRLEKSERPVDEQETLTKLISGLERAASDLSTIVQYARPLDIKKQPGVDLEKLIRQVCVSLNQPSQSTESLTGQFILEFETITCCGSYDPALLAEALKSISLGALRMAQYHRNPQAVTVRFSRNLETPFATIEWQGVNQSNHDPFRSFAGSHELKMSLAARIVEGHGGSAECRDHNLIVTLPISQ